MVGFPLPNRKSAFPRILFTMLLILMGCTPAPAAVEGAPTLAATAAKESATPIVQPEGTPLPGPLATPTSFVPKAVIKIASQSPLSGNLAIFGTDLVRGTELAVRQLAGGLAERGYELELLAYDDKNSIETAQANATEIVADSGVLCIVGHYGGRVTIQSSEIYHAAGLALVSPSVDHFALTELGYLEINRIIGRSDGQGQAGAQFAKAQGLTDVYIVGPKEQYGLRNAEYFKAEADQLGLQVLGMVILDETTDLDLVISDIIADNPKLVYFAGTADQAIPFFQNARAAGYSGSFLGLDDLNNPSLFGLEASSLVEGGGLYFTSMSVPTNFYPGTANFIQDFNIHYGAGPLLFAARAYDATGICIKAIDNASMKIGGAVPTRQQVAEAIRALQDYRGITGTYNFNANGDLTLAKYYVYKVVSVDPANWNQNLIMGSYDVAPHIAPQ